MPSMNSALLAKAISQGVTARDLSDPNSDWNRQQSDQDFEDYMAQYPGAAPGGTGATGLGAGDAAGWSNLLNRQSQYLQDKGATVKFGGYSPMTSITGSGSPGGRGGSGMGTVGYSDPFMQREADQLSLRGLRAATSTAEAMVPNVWTQYYENQDAQDAAIQAPRFREQALEAGNPDDQRNNLILDTQTKERLADQYATPDALRALKAQVAGIPYQDTLSEAAAGREMLPNAEALGAKKDADALALANARYGNPAQIKADSAAEIAAGKGTNTLDVANTRASADRYKAAFTGISNIIGKLQAAGAKPDQIAPYQAMLTAMGRSQPQGGQSGGGGTISEQDLQDAMTTNQWTRAQALAEAQKRGLTVR